MDMNNVIQEKNNIAPKKNTNTNISRRSRISLLECVFLKGGPTVNPGHPGHHHYWEPCHAHNPGQPNLRSILLYLQARLLIPKWPNMWQPPPTISVRYMCQKSSPTLWPIQWSVAPVSPHGSHQCICLTKFLQVFLFWHAKTCTKNKCTSIDTHILEVDTYCDLWRKKTHVNWHTRNWNDTYY